MTGNTGTGAIGDRVWADANGNGVQDPGRGGPGRRERRAGHGRSRWPLRHGRRRGGGDDDDQRRGNYIFDGLAAGGYVVRIPTPPAGYTQTGDPDGTLDNQTTQPIVLAPGDVFVNADFGYAPQDGLPNSIGDTVWLDVDRDGVQDAGEAGIPGVTVQLTWAGPDGNLATTADNVVYTTVTDDNGNYLFSDLPDGDFQVTTNLPSNTGAGWAAGRAVRGLRRQRFADGWHERCCARSDAHHERSGDEPGAGLRLQPERWGGQRGPDRRHDLLRRQRQRPSRSRRGHPGGEGDAVGRQHGDHHRRQRQLLPSAVWRLDRTR